MMTTRASRRGNSALFFEPSTEQMSSKSASRQRKVARKDATVKKESRKSATLIDGIVNGERVHVFVPPKEESERAIEIRIRAAVSAARCLVLKHAVDPCWQCGKKPSKRAGLGEGMTDLLIVCLLTKRAIFVEVKRPGYSPSDVRSMQRTRIRALRKLGIVAGIATCEEEALALVAEARAAR